MARFDDSDPGLPIGLGPCSNGEFLALPPTALALAAARRARVDAEENARRMGLTRRQFLLSSAGAATTLLALAACSSEQQKAASEAGRTTTSAPGGTFTVPTEATTDTTVADEVLGGADPIIDVQTHFLQFSAENPPSGGAFGGGFPQADCGDAEWWQCFSIEHWMEEIFLKSDTTLAVLSAVPVLADPDPLSAEVMDEARRVADQLCGDGRVLVQGHAVPNNGPLPAALDAMTELAASRSIAAWKVYTHASGPGWYLNDEVGEAFLGRVEEIGIPIVCVHKGFAGGSPYAAPHDVGPAAVAHPDVNFVVYHSGYEAGGGEGPFDPNGGGVDRFVATVQAAGVAAGANVYAELGSTWKLVMGAPDQAAHVLGKLLVAVGEDNILWGTDSIWYGTPQDQIQAFRTFEISGEFQERFGYPALTPEVKAKILGGNAARLYGIDPATVKCEFSLEDLAGIRNQQAMAGVGTNRASGPLTAADVAATFRRDHPWF